MHKKKTIFATLFIICNLLISINFISNSLGSLPKSDQTANSADITRDWGTNTVYKFNSTTVKGCIELKDDYKYLRFHDGYVPQNPCIGYIYTYDDPLDEQDDYPDVNKVKVHTKLKTWDTDGDGFDYLRCKVKLSNDYWSSYVVYNGELVNNAWFEHTFELTEAGLINRIRDNDKYVVTIAFEFRCSGIGIWQSCELQVDFVELEYTE